MITMQEWKVMSHKEQTLWLMKNKPAGKLSSSMRRPVYGVGVNDSESATNIKIDGVLVCCKAYQMWHDLLRRCYCQKLQEQHQTYIGVSVCDDWIKFSSFREWWLRNYIEGYHLDKDLLSDSRAYSPETSTFVPSNINTFIIDCGATRGDLPIGVTGVSGCNVYTARCSNQITGKREYLGCFKTAEEAHLAWRSRKLELALELKPKMDEIDLRIYPRVVEIINNAK